MTSSSQATPRVLLMVTGGIAAYKSCFLARLLVQAGFSVKVAMTEAAARFVTPVTLQVLTGHPVATDLWGEGQSEVLDHIEYARWADLVVVAPATANTMAKAAQGIGDEIVSTLLLAFPGTVLMAPAMNDNMWRHPATQANRKTLEKRGVRMVGPGSGWLACGTVDEGRMAEPEEILTAIRTLTAELPDVSGPQPTGGFWAGKKVLITAGPTHEPIDPVRYVANRSSGAMGFALAAAAVEAGARVTLISGPVALTAPRGLSGLVQVETALEMNEAVDEALGNADWLIMSAAVSDYRPTQASDGKLKKDDLGDDWQLAMARNPDILKEASDRGAGTKMVGFALETADMLANAQAKLKAKGLDYVVANDPTAAGSGFGPGPHRVTLIGPEGVVWASDSLPKTELAGCLLDSLALADS